MADVIERARQAAYAKQATDGATLADQTDAAVKVVLGHLIYETADVHAEIDRLWEQLN